MTFRRYQTAARVLSRNRAVQCLYTTVNSRLTRKVYQAIALLLFLGIGASASWAQSDDELWARATRDMGNGNDAQAVSGLNTLIKTHPNSPLADDALFLRAQLLEEKLGDPAAARLSYQELVDRFPSSRSALAASRRLQDLTKALGPTNLGAVPLATFQKLLAGFPKRSLGQSIAMAEAILQQHPNWQSLYKVKLWLAGAARKQGHLDTALSYYRDVQDSDAPRSAVVSAFFESSDVHILRGQYQKAETILSSLSIRNDLTPSEEQSVSELLNKLEKHRSRSIQLTLSYWGFGLMNLLLLIILRRNCQTWAGFVQKLCKPPMEFLYTLPFAILFFIMALTGHEEIAPAVGIISGGSLLITWIVGITLSSMAPLTLSRAGLCAALATLATACLCYYALYRSQLLDLIATTVQFGPE